MVQTVNLLTSVHQAKTFLLFLAVEEVPVGLMAAPRKPVALVVVEMVPELLIRTGLGLMVRPVRETQEETASQVPSGPQAAAEAQEPLVEKDLGIMPETAEMASQAQSQAQPFITRAAAVAVITVTMRGHQFSMRTQPVTVVEAAEVQVEDHLLIMLPRLSTDLTEMPILVAVVVAPERTAGNLRWEVVADLA